MIYLFYGENVDKARGKWRQVAESFATKYPDGNLFSFDAEHFAADQFEELIESKDLFGGKRLVVADRLLEDESALELVESKVEELVGSATVFAFLENKVDQKLIKKIEKAGGKAEEFAGVGSSTSPRPEFNLFALCDALGNRDRKQLWILSQQALFAGVPAEEIFWKLVWQTKMILLVTKSQGKTLKTVKPFVAGKSARFARQYSLSELEKLSGDLVALWHDTKRENGPDFALGLERLILSI
jgi:DNA polymerase III delta subunit